MKGLLSVIALYGIVGSSSAVSFFDNFDAGTSAGNWNLFTSNSDNTVNFAFDYSTLGIASAPHSSGGTTIGLYMSVNDKNAAVAGVSAFAKNLNFAGDYWLEFDMYMSYNGGAGGATGSTENFSAGINQSGSAIVWSGSAPSSSVWFTTTGEGGSARDYRAYKGTTEYAAASGVYAAGTDSAGNGPQAHQNAYYTSLFAPPTYETAGAPGKAWTTVRIEQKNNVIYWSMNGKLIATITDSPVNAGTIMLGYMDMFSSLSAEPNKTFVIYDNVRAVPEPMTLVGLGLGAAALISRKRRNR